MSESEVGVGSAISIASPIDHAPTTTGFDVGHCMSNQQAELGEALIIDDDEAVITVLEGLIKNVGYSVTLAHGGREGLVRFAERQAKIELVVLDIKMPEVDGIEVFRVIRKTAPNLPVLLASGHGPDSAVLGFLELDRVEFIHKPFRRAELLKKIQVLRYPSLKWPER